VDGTLHPLAHAVGFSGPVWHPASRGEQSRLHLSFLLTQEFIHVSAAVPPSVYGDPAVRFYIQSMPPPQLLHFPSNASKLLSALTVGWGYHQGEAGQAHTALVVLLPIMLCGCPLLQRFLNPAPNVSSLTSGSVVCYCKGAVAGDRSA